jgi:predicted phosphodiesterase
VRIEVRGDHGVLVTMLLTHIAVDRTRVRADVGRRARECGAGLVVCGHSHVPFAAHDRGLTLFNPGSVGPRRFTLPIVFGVIEVRREGVSLRHVDCETGGQWVPTR